MEMAMNPMCDGIAPWDGLFLAINDRPLTQPLCSAFGRVFQHQAVRLTEADVQLGQFVVMADDFSPSCMPWVHLKLGLVAWAALLNRAAPMRAMKNRVRLGFLKMRSILRM